MQRRDKWGGWAGREKWSQSASQGPASQQGTREPDVEEAENQDGQYGFGVNEPQCSTQKLTEMG